jgi:hypothetical protein
MAAVLAACATGASTAPGSGPSDAATGGRDAGGSEAGLGYPLPGSGSGKASGDAGYVQPGHIAYDGGNAGQEASDDEGGGGDDEAAAPGCGTGGPCQGGQTCMAGVCGTCVPTTCMALGANCGSVLNGCGLNLVCGSCTLPDTCGGGGMPNVCGCTPTTCTAANATCGSIADDCGNMLSCGSCATPQACSANACTTPCGDMIAPNSLQPGQTLVSCDGRFTLVEQSTDGNLVVYEGSTALWSASTAGSPGAYAVMQSDGNFVVYLGSTPLWSSGTAGNPGAWLAMQTDGNLVVYSASSVALWSSGTGGH